MLCYATTENNTSAFIADSGQVSTFLFCREPFNTSLNVIPQPAEINLGNGEAIEIFENAKFE